ncbi:MAG TPA: hypothetical protein PKH47_15580, partial [Anaerolineales bacterium]|nr:hypothetical protein [Anaerolineales bacterium]
MGDENPCLSAPQPASAWTPFSPVDVRIATVLHYLVYRMRRRRLSSATISASPATLKETFSMQLKGSVTIKAPRNKVWDFLTDPN